MSDASWFLLIIGFIVGAVMYAAWQINEEQKRERREIEEKR